MEKRRGIGHYFKIICKEFECIKNKNLSVYDLTSQQFSIIMYLNRNKGKEINQKDIEEDFKLSSSTVSGLLYRLETKGFIQRKTSEVDSRYKIISPTENTFLFKEAMQERVKKNEELLLKGFNEEEKIKFAEYLNRILKNIYRGDKND